MPDDRSSDPRRVIEMYTRGRFFVTGDSFERALFRESAGSL